MLEQNKALMGRFYKEIVNQAKYDLIDELVGENFVDHQAIPGQGPGGGGLKWHFGMFRAAFPDVRVEIEDMIAEGDKVVTRFTIYGTHKGEFHGVSPTNTQVVFTETTIARVVGGKITDLWANVDSLGMLRQLGVFKLPGE